MPAALRFLLLPILVVLALALGACGSDDDTDPATTAEETGASGATGASAAPAGDSLRYAVIGDSNSNGENAGPGQQFSPDEIAWPAQLAQRLTDEGLPVELVANPAITGATVEQAAAEELQPFEDARPDVATLMLGGNDYVNGVTPEDFRTQFRDLLDEMIEIVGGAERVVVVSPTAFYVTPSGKDYITSLDEAEAAMTEISGIVEEEAADAGAPFVSVFEISEGMGDDPSLVTPDGLHATEKELALWTDAITPVATESWSAVAGEPDS